MTSATLSRPVAATDATTRSPGRTKRWTTLAVLGCAILVALALRLWGLNDLRVWGDGAYSVYLAGFDPLTMIRLTAQDSHPPLYYLLLAIWTDLAGTTELTVRWVSVAFGVLLVPLTYVCGSRFLGRPAAVVGAWLIAVSPVLWYYSRFPRMYTLLAAVVLVALYIAGRVLAGRPGRWQVPAFGVALWLAVHIHYFGAVAGLSLGAVLLLLRLRGDRRAGALLLSAVVAGLLSIPWLAYGFLGSARFTASNIANAPAPSGLSGFVEQYAVPFFLGPLVDMSPGRAVALGLVAGFLILAAVALVGRCGRAFGARRWWVPAAFVAASVILTFAIFLIFPYFARHRFLIFAVPPALLLLAALLVAAWRAIPAAALAAAAVLTLTTGWALADAYRVESLIYEPDAVRLTHLLETYAGPNDLVIWQAAWQFGYLRAHYDGPPVETRDLNDVTAAEALEATGAGRRVWLAMYDRGVRDPDFPLEEALDRALPRVLSRDLDRNRVILYTPPPDSPAAVAETVFHHPETGVPVARLIGAELPAERELTPGDALPVELTWEALGQPPANLSAFLHLDSLDGQTFAARDAEPLAGLAPTSTWQPGQNVVDPRGLVVPPNVPPGAYELRLGLYDPADLTPLTIAGQEPGRPLTLARFEVTPATGGAGPGNHSLDVPLNVQFTEPIYLAGVSFGDPPRIVRTDSRQAYLDNPAALHRPKAAYSPGETLDVTLHWRALEPVSADYTVFVHLIGPDGRPVAQRDSPPLGGRYPTSRWMAGAVLPDTYHLELPKDLPAGTYRLIAGLYRPDTGERVQPVSGAGRRPDRAIEVGTIDVAPDAADGAQ